MKSYADILNGWLGRMGLSPGQAAALLGVSPSTAYEHAAGRSVPPASRIPSLAAAIGVSEAKLRQVINKDRARRHANKSETTEPIATVDEASATPVRS